MQSEAELLSSCRAEDAEAFVALIRRYEKRIAGTIHSILGNCPEIDDVGQEVFIRFFRNLAQFRGECSLATYLTRIAINLSLNELKRRRRRQWLFPASLDEAQHVAASTRNPAEEEELQQLLHNAVLKLPEKYRLVVVLRLIETRSIRETAEILDVAEGTVMSRLARAQELMRRELHSVLGESHE